MPHNGNDERIDYGTLHGSFIREARSAVAATPGLGPSASFRSTRDPQVFSTQDSVIAAFGLRLSGMELIKHFPLPEGFSRDIFMREVLIVMRKTCPLIRNGKRRQSDTEKKIIGIRTERRLRAADRIEDSGEDTLGDDDLRYRDAYASVLSCIFRSGFESISNGIFPQLDESVLNSAGVLSEIIAFDLDRNHTPVPLGSLVDSIRETRELKGMTQTAFETELEIRFGYTGYRRLRQGIQKSCGFNIIDRSAYTIETTAYDIYRKAEEIVERGTNMPEIPQDECKIPQDENKFSQISERNPQGQCQIPQDKSKFSQAEGEIPQVKDRFPQSVSKYSQNKGTIPQVKDKFPQSASRFSQNKCKNPQAGSYIPLDECKFPQDKCNFSQAEGIKPQVEDKFPQSASRFSENKCKNSQVLSAIPLDECKFPQDKYNFSQVEGIKPQVEDKIPQSPSRFPENECKNSQVLSAIPLVESKFLQIDNKNPQAESKFPRVGSRSPGRRKRDKASIPGAIIDFCFVPRSLNEIKSRLGYSDRKTVLKFITALLASGDLRRTIPDKPSSGNQKYMSVRKKKE